jgi:hypothetical protein
MSLPDPDPNRQGVSPETEARLRDPRHPVHHGLQLYPVPNLIVTRSRPHVGERYLRMSKWMRKTVVWAHYSPLQKFLLWAGLVALIATVLAAPFIVGPVDCAKDAGRAICTTTE